MAIEKIRLQKFLSECGIASRRKSEELIENGFVKVNGKTASIGDKVDPKRDSITVHGKKVFKQKKCVYLMLNKPRGFITTMSDEMDRKCVASLVEDAPARVYPVGRLDKESEGMLLFTNDGEFANALTHPSKHVSKTYRVTVRPPVTEEQLTAIATGIVIDDRKTAPADVRVILQEERELFLKSSFMKDATDRSEKCVKKSALRSQDFAESLSVRLSSVCSSLAHGVNLRRKRYAS